MKLRFAMLSMAVFAAVIVPSVALASGKLWSLNEVQNNSVSVNSGACPSGESDSGLMIHSLALTQDIIDDMTDALNNGGTATVTLSVEASSSITGDGRAWYGAEIAVSHVVSGGGRNALFQDSENDFAANGLDFFKVTDYEANLDLAAVGQMSDGDTLVTVVRGSGNVLTGMLDGDGDGDPCESIDQAIVHVNIPSMGRPKLFVNGL